MIATAISTQERSGQWRVTVDRGCGHRVESPARFPAEAPARRHGDELLRHGCLQCVLGEVVPGEAS